MADQLVEFLDSLKDLGDHTGIVKILVEETLNLRDRLSQSGVTLTVGDTRVALDALEDYLRGVKAEAALTENQRTLYQAWRRRLETLPRTDGPQKG